MAVQFRFLGILTRVHVWFLLTGWILWTMGTSDQVGNAGFDTLLITWAILFQAIYMHELGHALVGRRFGLDPQIELVALGGQTRWKVGRPLTPAKRLLVSFAGPAVGLVVGFPAVVAAFTMPTPADLTVQYALSTFAFFNFGWAAFNLAPLLPLDGGNIMAALFQMASPAKGQRAARYVSFVVIAALGGLFLLIDATIMALFMLMFAGTNYQGLVAEKKLEEAKAKLATRLKQGLAAPAAPEAVADVAPPGVAPDVRAAYEALAAGDAERLAEIAGALVVNSVEVDARDEAFHFLAWARLLGGEPAEARAALDAMSGTRDPDPALAGAVHLELGEPALAVVLFLQALEDGAGGSFVEKRLLTALAAADDWARAVQWLESPAARRVDERFMHRVQAGAFFAGAFEPALTLGRLLFERFGQPHAAFNVACCLARLERPEEALEWVGKSLDAGLTDGELLDGDEDLASVRALPGWSAVRARVD